MRLINVLASLAIAALPLSGAVAKDAALAKAIASPTRTPAMVERDKYRHPQEVLEFAGIKPSSTVVEIAPGGGYWTEILAPYLKDKGTYYIAMTPRTASERAAKQVDDWNKKLADNKAHWGNAKVAEFGKGDSQVVKC